MGLYFHFSHFPQDKECWASLLGLHKMVNDYITYIFREHYLKEKAETGVMFPQVAAAAAKSLQSCPTLCDPIDSSPPGSPIPGILQARTLEWIAISFSNAWKWKVKVKSFSSVRLLATPWTTAYQAPPSMRFFQARVLEWGAIAFSENRIILLALKFLP